METGNVRMERKTSFGERGGGRLNECRFGGWRKDHRRSGLDSTKRKSKFVSLLDIS